YGSGNCRSFKREFELSKQPHTRRLPFCFLPADHKCDQSHLRRDRFPLRSFVCLTKSEPLSLPVPSAIPWRAEHATRRPSQPCKPTRWTCRRLPSRAPSTSFPSRSRGNSRSACWKDDTRDHRFGLRQGKFLRSVSTTGPANAIV